jgi:small-conductance mechanosensitive channel
MAVLYTQGIDFAMTKHVDFGAKLARVLYTIWIAFRIMQFKRYLLGRAVNKSPEKLGKIMIYDRILDVIIYAALSFSIMDTVEVEYGAGFKSLFAFGGVGTLVFSLASKDMATLFVSGLVLSTSEKFIEGDVIELGDKTTGTVVKTGLLYTSIRREYSENVRECSRMLFSRPAHHLRSVPLYISIGGDEHVVKIPNTQLANQRVSNLSRMTKCQVTQELRFHYSDLDKVPQIISKIKEEIEAMCPKLITDGSRPFRCSLTEFAEDHFKLVVDTRHNLPPLGVSWALGMHSDIRARTCSHCPLYRRRCTGRLENRFFQQSPLQWRKITSSLPFQSAESWARLAVEINDR